MTDHQLKLFAPDDVFNRKDGYIRNWDSFSTRFLAQGDSWFSYGTIPAWDTSNILQQILLGFEACAINCAQPGQRMVNMVEWKRDTGFAKLLSGKFAEKWHGILLSGGGNDLICATSVLPFHSDGTPVEPHQRLLLNQPEWGPASAGASRYISDAGWATFVTHLSAQFADLVAARDKDINRDIPLFCHCYDYMQPRNARAFSHMGPWLYPAFVNYAIPPGDWLGVVSELIDRLKSLLSSTIDSLNAGGDKRLYLIDSRGALAAAQQDSTGPSHDWQNEIHPTREGYAKLAARWQPVIDAQFPTA
jgi:hypothetical protein